MAGFVRSDTDTTPLGIMMMAQRSRLGMRMKKRYEDQKDLGKGDASFWWCYAQGQNITTRTEWVLSMMLVAVILIR